MGNCLEKKQQQQQQEQVIEEKEDDPPSTPVVVLRDITIKQVSPVRQWWIENRPTRSEDMPKEAFKFVNEFDQTFFDVLQNCVPETATDVFGLILPGTYRVLIVETSQLIREPDGHVVTTIHYVRLVHQHDRELFAHFRNQVLQCDDSLGEYGFEETKHSS